MHAMYELRRFSDSATDDLEGKYQCIFKRQPHTSYIDKSYVLGTMKKRAAGVNVFRPYLNINSTMVPCNSEEFAPDLKILRVVRGTTTCLRCRGHGKGQTEVGLYVVSTGRPVKDMAGVSAHPYVNVAAAGVREVLYVIRDVQDKFHSRYECITRTVDGTQSNSYEFSIEMKRR